MEDSTYDAQLLADVRRCVRRRQLSVRTEETYLSWIRRFLRFARLSSGEVPDVRRAARYIEYLTKDRRLSASTQNLAASAVAFLFREVWGVENVEGIPRARARQRRPHILSGPELKAVFAQLSGVKRLAATLMYGTGVRLTECMQVRVKDVTLDSSRLVVRDGKGGKDRDVPLPGFILGALRRQTERVAELHDGDLARGQGWAQLPGALHIKSPGAGYELAWQFLFPASKLSRDPASGRYGRYHLHTSVIQRAVKEAVRRSGINKAASCHSFRHSFATHSLRMGRDVETLKTLMGHRDVKTTMIYVHALDTPGFDIESPLDRLMRNEEFRAG